ncbi:MAG: glycosyltransferase [Candidatus Pedobacter colombiensis]|uniref:Glycosyltransferase n=1 Tax=Candidatus Pedobacter colombiensis TaxID=3121371 RepID=A0AAJ5W7U7_9SPHI|nr:glycosyltransferase [Pedobacter sp.]WEK19701.1 MAG: glycosyltransferase [Pedobacter sp.]
MKILFILPEYLPHSGGGISTYYQHYIQAMKPHCEKISVIVGSGYLQSYDHFDDDGVAVEYLRPDLFLQYSTQFSKYDLLPDFKNNIAAAWAMWQQARQGDDFDIIECTDFGLGFIPWAIHHQKPVITRLHGSSGQIALHEHPINGGLVAEMYRQTELALLPLSDSLITYSQANQTFWNQMLTSKSVHHFHPIYTVSNPILPYKERENFGLVTARMQQWKGPVQLSAALQLMENPPLIKWIGRDMPFNDELGTDAYLKAKFPGIWGKKIIPQRPLANEEIKPLQQQAKFGIVPSSWDMFNFSCLEFLAAGTPVICAEEAGVSELIEHGKNGFKYPANDLEALAQCIQTITESDEESYHQIALSGLETISTLLSATMLIPGYLEHYQSVVSNFNPGSSNVFLNESYSPSAHEYPIASILDKQSLKKLMIYIYNRLKSKFL